MAQIFNPKGEIVKHSFLAGTTAALALFAGSTAFADVTPDEVWTNWQAMMTAAGQTMTTADISTDGGNLVVSGLTLSHDSPSGSFSSSVEEVNFIDNGDGTVTVKLSDSYPLLIKAPAPEGIEGAKPTDLKLTITQPEMKLIASGTPDALNYDITAPTLSVKLEAINGKDSSVIDLTVDAVITNLIGKYMVSGPADAQKVDSNFSMDQISFVAGGKNDETKTELNFTGNLDGVTGKTNAVIVDTKDMAKAFAAGFAVNSEFSYTASKFDLSATTDGKPTTVAATSGAGSVTVAIDSTHLQYGVSAKTAAISLSSPEIPFPQVDLSYDEATFNLDMPTAKSDSPSDFAFLTRLVGFNVSEPIWGMIDPTGALPHDGATVIIDTKGKATLKSDLFAEMEQGAGGTPPDGELNAIDLTELNVSIAGAQLTGAGAFTFDNSDMTTFDGMPAPTGKVDLKLTGANTLLDKIVEMGYISADDVMGYKMMAGMFTNATPDKDELTSSLEFKDKGFYANGQRLK